ncbi:MAG: hypothetical protein GC164_12420 [Phycisphaera sp.]|nr:hypothetical protein [Phycisphaera sp.]
MKPIYSLAAVVLVCFFTATTSLAQGGYYDDSPELFSMRPDPNTSVTTFTEFGPVGVSLDLLKPDFAIRVKSVEPGSPADKAALKPGMMIHTINGEKLANIDPRIQLGNMITKAEATDGKMRMVVSDKPGGETREVVVQLEALGPYSATWPVNCQKSDRIVRNFAEYLKKDGSDKGFGSLGMLFLLSTGDDNDLGPVREWAHNLPAEVRGFHTWNAGLGSLAVCEYYLRTGDEQVLPAIQALADSIATAENNGGWGNRAPISGLTYGGGGGHLNAGGIHAATFLVLAKECGAKIDDEVFLRVVRHFYRFAGRGNIPYGNNKPEGSYTDNGKNGGFALTMAAAASLTPDGEDSTYAKARDITALFSFPSTSFILHGHTGGGIGEIFRSAAMGLLCDKQPALYRDFMDQRRWHYEISRKFDGSFRIFGGDRYDNVSWGAGYALTYTVPRKTLRLTGAAPGKFAKPYKLPEHPWGTAADEDFVTTQPIAYPDGSRPDFSHDTLANGGGIALLRVNKDGLTDEQLNRYIRHPVIITRTYFIKDIAQRGPDFVLNLLRDPDARMRRLALDTMVSRDGSPELATPAVIDRVIQMVADPEESWFVKEAALRAVALAPADTIVKHVDTFIPYLNHEEWWLQHSAMEALGPVVVDPRVYKKVLPPVAQALKNNHLQALANPFNWGTMGTNLGNADPEVAAFACSVLGEAYTDYVEYKHPMPVVEDRVNPGMREIIASTLAKVPGGYDTLYRVARSRNPDEALPYSKLFLSADTESFSPELRALVNHSIENQLIPAYIASNRAALLKEKSNQDTDGKTQVYGLVGLYNRLGVKDYDWHDFGPVPTEMAWSYLTFDPVEKKPWDSAQETRYRPVTVPKGNEDWYKPTFNPSEHGWQVGLQPFGATNGKLVGATIDGSDTSEKPSPCKMDFCRCKEPMKTLWDKEVLLLNGKFTFPEFKEGYRYRLLVGGMSHVGAGEGFKIYVNGKPFFERGRGVGRREGGLPIEMHIDKSWWKEFSGKEVDIAHISFMNIHKGIKSRQLMIWVQEMKLPPLDEAVMIHSATVVPMTCAAWQSLQDPDNTELDPDEGRYLWDGKFVDNPAIVGQWKTVALVNTLDEFNPAKPINANRAAIRQLEFKPEGRTDDPLLIWTGQTLLNLKANQALAMRIQNIAGVDYLLVEQGGFNAKNGPDWKSPLIVMARR